MTPARPPAEQVRALGATCAALAQRAEVAETRLGIAREALERIGRRCPSHTEPRMACPACHRAMAWGGRAMLAREALAAIRGGDGE